MTLPSLYIFTCLNYYKKHENEFSAHSDFHEYNTRHKNNLCPKEIRLRKSQNAVNYFIIKFYNKIPHYLKKYNSKNFNKAIKKLLISSAYYSYDEFLEDKSIV